MATTATTKSRQRRPHSLPLGRPFGIPLRIHVTFLFLVVFVLLAASASHTSPLVAVGWLAGLFGCVVVHELAHSLVARRFGIDVREIELLPIGGVSQMSRAPDQPRQELLIAAAGPAASFVVGALAAVLGLVMSAALWPPRLGIYLTANEFLWINLLLGGFNLLPAFPLDGGRIYRAWLERRYDRARATRIAAHTGRVLAVGLGVVGLLFDLWLVLIAVFVFLGSRAEEIVTLIHAGLGDRRVSELMMRSPRIVNASSPVPVVAGWLGSTAQREFPVVDDLGHYVGMLESDQLYLGDATLAGDVAVSLETVERGDRLEDIVLGNDLRSRAVVQDGQVVGLLRREDLLSVLRRSTANGARA
jgi:Zn-dependent protease